MGRQEIKDLKVGDKVVEFYQVKSKRVQKTKTGKPYLNLDLQDKTGIVNAKVWERAEQFSGLFQRGDVIKVRGEVEDYQGARQLRVLDLRLRQDKDGIEDSEFIKSSPHDLEADFNFLIETIASMTNPHLRSLLQAMFEDPELAAAFKKSAAARNIHHVYQGGLLEHTAKVTRVCRFMVEEIYGHEVDRDLVLAGAILHDVGKVRELDSGGEIGYTTEGYLIGHVVLGSALVREWAARTPDFPQDLLRELDHILLSHHGEREFGSPVVPMTAEAMIVQGADNLEAKTQIALQSISDDPNQEEEFTQYHRTLARHFYKGRPKETAGQAPDAAGSSPSRPNDE